MNATAEHAAGDGPGEAPAILAAGGILRGDGAEAGRIAIVRRHRHGAEAALPKGKVVAGEDLQTAALREVKEETGYDARIVGYAGTTHYAVDGRPKAVSYFLMNVVNPTQRAPIDGSEIAAVEWLTPAEARAALTHRGDRDLVAAVFGLGRERGVDK